jgi:hypothetical protein
MESSFVATTLLRVKKNSFLELMNKASVQDTNLSN